ncbi:ATP-dependent nuclease [Thalassospira xiamenensis]|uniref:ATP-dependent endonuclease n=1 Tax=Thalassospira xiamenensis TaxID=220697 RepID=A0ABR5XX81_9PROT|nr:AAA family ATPase [Thalassospira xiamenensis]KZC98270.1 ATP-dependent endonuclease [Thalassospira xiamenensis]KZD09702.1 ATP-dependent endonuclease [Thalassospira xiamenensis]
MHISKLQLINFRNFERAEVVFKKGVNTIIGENGSGKTNLFRALRLLVDDSLLRMAYKLDEKDFHRGLGDWRGHWIIISLEFDEVSQDEAIQSLFLHGTGNIADGIVGKATYNLIFRPNAAIRRSLSELEAGDTSGLAELRAKISVVDYETIFTGKSTADFLAPATYKALVGDFDAVIFPTELIHPQIGGIIPGMLSISREVSFTFVQALRDVVADFQNNRTNPLLTLLKSQSGEIDPASFKPISSLVKNLNSAIEELPDVGTIRADIRETIIDAAGETYSPRSLSIRSDLSDEADRLFQSLKLFVGETDEGYEGAIHELSLGGANLIYLTLKLLEFKYQKQKEAFANFLVIEEPEAHIHTHIQKTLFDRLNYDDTQVIYSTHSTHISEVSNVENINILGRQNGRCEVFQPSVGLDPIQIGNIQRYLDAVRSNLLFAKSVLLVEGDAEEILIPILVKKMFGLSLDELGISLVNIRSTGFENIAILFHDMRIQKRCAIITDLDRAFIPTDPDPFDTPELAKAKKKALASQSVGSRREAVLNSLCQDNQWLSAHYATHTFEVDFVAADNSEIIVSILGDIYKDPATIAAARAELESGDVALFGKRVLTMANKAGKGWFAILVGRMVTSDTPIPAYILAAIFQAHLPVSVETWASVLTYRLTQIEKKTDAFSPELIAQMRDEIVRYRRGELSFQGIRSTMLTAFSSDAINTVLAGF